MPQILFGQDSFRGVNQPVYSKRFILYRDSAVGFRVVIVVAFVLEHRNVAEDGKSVGESAGDEELAVIVLREFNGHVLAVGGRALADVDGYIEHTAFNATHKF